MNTCFRTIVAALALLLSWIGSSSPDAQGERLSAPLEPTVTGSIDTFQISPDGVHIVYTGTQDRHEVTELYSALRSGGTPVRLNPTLVEGGDVSESFVISPDGGRVLYIADQEQDDVFELYSVPVDGSAAPIRLSDIPLDSSATPTLRPVRISPDGSTALFLTRSVALDALHAVPIDGSAPAVWLGGQLVGDYRFSPDSQHVVFKGRALGQLGLFRASRDGSTPVQTLLARPDQNQLEFQISADGTWIVCRSDLDVNEAYELLSVPLLGGPIVALQGATDRTQDVETFVPSPTSDRVVYTLEGRGLFAARIDGSSAPIQLDTQDPRSSTIELTSDGAHVVYSRKQGAVLELYSVPIDGSSAPAQLSVGTNGAFYFGITADGTRVVFQSGSDWRMQHELYRVPIDGSQLPQRIHPALPAGRRVVGFQLGAAHDRVVYRADSRIEGVYELFTARIDGVGRPVRLSDSLPEDADVSSSRISPDGTWAVHRADATQDGVFELFLATGAHPTPRVNGPVVAEAILTDVASDFRLTPDEERVLYHVARDWFVVPTVPGQKAVRLDALRDAQGLRFTPDGARVVFERDRGVYAWPLDGCEDPIALCDAVAPSSGPPDWQPGQQWQLSRDGSHVVCRSERNVAAQWELFSIPIDGHSKPIRLNGDLVEGRDVWTPSSPSFVISPDGSRVVYVADEEADELFELFSVPIDGSAPAIALSRGSIPVSRVTDMVLDDRSLSVVYRAYPYDTSGNLLFAAPLDGSAPPLLLRDATGWWYLQEGYRIAPGGTHVVYGLRNDVTWSLYAQPIDGSAPAVGLFSSHRRSSAPFDVTPDGGEVVVVTLTGSLLSRPIDGSLPARELAAPSGGPIGDVFHFALGGSLVVYGDPSGVHSVPVDGSDSPLLISDPPSGGYAFAVTASGTSVVYEAVTGGAAQLFTSTVRGTIVQRPLSGPLYPGGRFSGWELGRNGRVFYVADQDVPERFELYATPPTERTFVSPSGPRGTLDHAAD